MSSTVLPTLIPLQPAAIRAFAGTTLPYERRLTTLARLCCESQTAIGLYRRDNGTGARIARPAVPSRRPQRYGRDHSPPPHPNAATPAWGPATLDRSTHAGEKAEYDGGSGLPYVYTKPGGRTTILRSTDSVYVLTSPAVAARAFGGLGGYCDAAGGWWADTGR